MEDRIREAFDGVRADPALLERTAASVRERAAAGPGRVRPFPLRRMAVAAAAVLLLLVGTAVYRLGMAPVAHVGIDVNPSVELSLNRLDRVVAASAYNPEGEALLEGLSLRGMPYGQAAVLLVEEVEAQGYLDQTPLVSVTVQTGDAVREERLRQSLERIVRERLQADRVQADLEVFAVSQELWTSARECHLSAAKYLAILELMEVDEQATPEAYGHHSIQQIRARTQAHGGGDSHDDGGTGSDSGHGGDSGNGNRGGGGGQSGQGHHGQGGHG